MNILSNQKFSKFTLRHSSGSFLLEVMIAMVIFALGLLALASLQGNLARSSTDANSRTVGTNIAEEFIEQLRTFEQIRATAACPTGLDLIAAANVYQCIQDATVTVTRGGIDYAVAANVTDLYFAEDGVTVTDDVGDLPDDWDTTISSFKHLELEVTWSGNPEFMIDQAQASGLGSGSFTVTSIIPSVPQLGTASVAADDDGALGAPPVKYSPGSRPDIIALTVDTNKFKESTTPEPIVRRADELIETWFDVITYSGTTNATFLRREEFVSISCECTLRRPGGADDDGRGPTLWTGAEYAEGAKTGKWWGEPAGNQQSQYCDVCCQDHHDSGASIKYRPWMANNEYLGSGDHPHYNRNNKGNEVLADKDGDNYLEACRLIRKDGYFRVAQDFNLNQVNAFPEDYLVSDADVSEYTGYVNDVADYNLSQVDVSTEPAAANTVLSFMGRDTDNPTDIPTLLGPSQQLRSRGLYIDEMNPLLQANIDRCFGGGGDGDPCEAPEATSVYELYPYFEVQVTALARWKENAVNNPVHISNEELSKNGYSRGFAELAGTKTGRSTGTTTIETGNVGLISTNPVASVPVPEYKFAEIFIRANMDDTGGGGGGGGMNISGSLSDQGGTSDSAVLILAGTGLSCNKPTNSTYVCTYGAGIPANPTLTISNYYKNNTPLLICSSSVAVVEVAHSNTSSDPTQNWTTFSIPPGGITGVTFTISKTGC